MSVQSYKRVNERIMVMFAKTLVGCDFDMGQDEKYMTNYVKHWLNDNNKKIEKLIRETTGEN